MSGDRIKPLKNGPPLPRVACDGMEESLHAPRSTLHAPRSTLHAPRASLHAPRSTLHAPRSTLHAPRSTPRVPRPTLHAPRPTRLALALLLCACAGCAGYNIGNQTLFPANISTVHVPVFQSDSLRRDLGEQLTEAVCKEIERRTPYKVVATPNADSVLSGKIVGEGKHLLVQNLNGDPREIEVNLRIVVSWIDRRGNVVRPCPPVPLPSELVDMNGASGVVPEVGQSVATGQQRVIRRLAEQIVSLMEAPW